jgi:hypothetical protein
MFVHGVVKQLTLGIVNVSVMLIVVMLSVFEQTVVKLNVDIPSVIILNVVASF